MADGKVIYECVRCGTCCRWRGIVRLTAAEVDAIAKFLGITPEAFVEQYTDIAPDRRSLALIDNAEGYCIMLTAEGLCRINPVKPQQCRDFPSRWNFPGFERLCQSRRRPAPDGS